MPDINHCCIVAVKQDLLLGPQVTPRMNSEEIKPISLCIVGFPFADAIS